MVQTRAQKAKEDAVEVASVVVPRRSLVVIFKCKVENRQSARLASKSGVASKTEIAEGSSTRQLRKRKAEPDFDEPQTKRSRQRETKVEAAKIGPIKRFFAPSKDVPTPNRRSKIVTLKVRFREPSIEVVTKPKAKPLRFPKGYFTNSYSFKFDWTPFPEFTSPSTAQCLEVYDILDKHHEEANFNAAHASDGFSVDALVKTILSQATDNELAIVAHHRLLKAFTYLVDGVETVGKIPNYHKVRVANDEFLTNALKTAGLYNGRAEGIKKILNTIKDRNDALVDPTSDIPQGNPDGATDFIPGRLDVSFLKDLTQGDAMDYLLSLPLIGVKTAACILAFNLGFDVFAVDTHVFRLSKLLGWIPESCNNPNRACCHLDFLIPSELKYKLHQAFWVHGQECERCKKEAEQTSKAWSNCVCPLEHLMTRAPAATSAEKIARKQRQTKARETKAAKDGSVAVKPKAQRGPKTVISAKEAAKRGIKGIQLVIDNNFGAGGGVITGTKTVFFLDADEGSDVAIHADVEMKKAGESITAYFKTVEDKQDKTLIAEEEEREEITDMVD